MANAPGLATFLSGGALLGTVMAALGLRKMISTEVKNSIVPVQHDIDTLKLDMEGVQGRLGGVMSVAEHKTICTLNAKNVDQRFKSLERTTQLQFNGLKSHIDTRFNDLFERMDQRRETYDNKH